MKSAAILLLVSAFICLTLSLQLSSHREHIPSNDHQLDNGIRPFYPKHYLGYRSEHYKQMVIQENKEKIQEFNNNNKRKLKSASVGGQVTGGNSFVEEANKFIGFTEDEFIKLFTGLNRPQAEHAHRKATMTKTHKEAAKSNSHQIFENHILKKVGASNHLLEMQNHDSKVWMENEEHNLEGEEHDGFWSFLDPFSINDTEIKKMYGNVNSDDNVGWDWKSADPNYYATPKTNDFTSYWKSWEGEHWGFLGSATKNLGGLFSGSSSGSGSSNSWWSSISLPWSSSSTPSSSSSSWWSSIFSTPSKPNNPGIIVQPSGPVQPMGPVQPTKPSNGTKPPVNPANNNTGTKPIAAYPAGSMDVNWVIKGATTHVKEQGQCGSCWTFSANGVIESYLLIKGRGRVDLSEQQLVDCQRNRCLGCNGGFENLGLDYAAKNGLVAEDKYPYRGFQQKCSQTTGPYKIPKYINVSGRSKMQQALRKGPITGAVYVDDGFQFYKKGIFDRCIKDTANHAVVIVGFTTEYWIIRNSWGADWGEEGHIRVKRDQNNKNACSIQDEAYGVAE